VALTLLTPELNSSAQRCLTRFFTGDFASWTVRFVNKFANLACCRLSWIFDLLYASEWFFSRRIVILSCVLASNHKQILWLRYSGMLCCTAWGIFNLGLWICAGGRQSATRWRLTL
jgi:hypothetical protein